MRKVSTTCPSLNVMDLLKCLFIVSNNTSTNLMSKLPCLRLWTDASRINMKQSNKDLKTETKHQRWSSWISTSGVVSTAATAAARVRAWSSAFAAPRIVTRQCAAFSFHFPSIFHPELMDSGRLYMALLRSCSSDCSVTVPRKWMRDVFMSDDFSTLILLGAISKAEDAWQRCSKWKLCFWAIAMRGSSFPQSFLGEVCF